MKSAETAAARAPSVNRVRWRGRKAICVSNGIVEMVALEGGGHIAEFRFADGRRQPGVNVLWECPWEGATPGSAKARRLATRYGAKGVGGFLASFTGHALCLDYFGMASPEETRRGMPLHGEAACAKWQIQNETKTSAAGQVKLQVALSAAGLDFSRVIEIRKNQSVAVIEEEVRNRANTDHYFHWVQHATLGRPFLDPEYSRVFLSGSKARTWPLGYENKSLVASDREFRWPQAPREKGGKTDLSIPFRERGTGFLASVWLDNARKLQFIATLNWKLGLLSGYVFCRNDFPWVAVWEENGARSYAPWNGRTQARGMEFGTTPMPIGKEATFLAGKLFDTACWMKLPARATRTVRYAAFLAEVPKDWRGVRDVEATKAALVLRGSSRGQTVKIAASGIGRLYA